MDVCVYVWYVEGQGSLMKSRDLSNFGVHHGVAEFLGLAWCLVEETAGSEANNAVFRFTTGACSMTRSKNDWFIYTRER